MTYSKQQRNELRRKYSEKLIEDPYFYWPFDFSPTESIFWNDIRCRWIKLYPEYPVLNYFLDFADPINKIWIEIDWEEWHRDKIKDKKRQDEIEKEWWEIHRFSWSDIYRMSKEPDYDSCFDNDEFMELFRRFEIDNKFYIDIINRIKEKQKPRENTKPELFWDIFNRMYLKK